MKYRIMLLASIFLLQVLSPHQGYTQGCSDAGFCTIGAIKPSTTGDSSRHKHAITLLSAIGTGDDGVLVVTPALQHDWQLSARWSLQTKVAANYADGTLGSTFDFGDIYLSGSYLFNPAAAWQWTGLAGIKIPLSKSNLSEGGMPLPMQYQSSLGTFDFIAGISLASQHWQFAAAFQQPLTDENKNGFLYEYWNGKSEALNYPETNRFQRKGDVLLRGSRNFSAGQKWQFNAGVLAIFHLGEDRYVNPFMGQDAVSIAGSSGTTLNLTGAVWFDAGKRTRLGLTGGVPLAVREVRPDGLTRQWVLAPEIRWNF
jgi:hypothetical protein